MSLSRGDVVAGAFEVEVALESDNACEVYRARHLISGKRVTLKVLKRSVDWCEAMVSKTTKLGHVSVDTVAKCIHQGPAGRGRWCFAFEWVATDELETKFPRGASIGRTAAIGACLAEALAALHEQGLAHGQLRPERIVMTGKDGSAPKLCDFILPPERMWLTANAPYVAPEVIVGGAPTPEADVFALGIMLWELVARRTLSPSETRLGVFLQTLFDTPDELECDDAAFASWVARMMAVEPLERPEASQVEAALKSLSVDGPAPALSAPTTRDEVDGRVGSALALLVIRPPPGKDAKAVGLDADWRRDVEGHGLSIVTLPDGALLGRIRGRTASAVAVSAGLVARATQETAFRASIVAGLLEDASAGESDAEAERAARVAARRAELRDIASVASRTPVSVTRFTARLAGHVSSSVGLKPSADSFLLAPVSSPRPKRGGTLEIDTTTTKMPAAGKRRKTGEIEIDEKPARGRGGTLVIEPGPEHAAKPASPPETRAEAMPDPYVPITPDPTVDAEPRRGKQDTLVIEMEPPTQQNPESATAARVVPQPKSSPKPDLTRVAPVSTKMSWARKPAAAELPGSDAPTLEIEVSDELRELSKVDEKLKSRRKP